MPETDAIAAPAQTVPYSPLVAFKSSAWLAGKLAATNSLMPKALAALTYFYGSAPATNSYVYKALPYAIIVGLHLVHDYERLKTSAVQKWL
jgi:hypothetical protein